MPLSRSGIVERRELVDSLLATPASVVTVVAPPGYGKTTVLAQWAVRLAPRAFWITCEDADNDPATMWAAIMAALRDVAPPDWSGPRLLAQVGGGLSAVPALVSTLRRIDGPVTLVLDQAETIRSRDSWAALAEFSLRLPAGWRLAFASREALPLPTSRLRMQGSLHEAGVVELAMSSTEAAALFAGTGVVVTDAEARELVRQTEGWPAGLYLASLAVRSGATASGFTFTGDDRLMRDYLRSELLARVSPEQRDFLVRTSILEQLTGPLCDAVLARTGSAADLEQLEARNLLVVPLDRRGAWYRYHHLLRDLLRSELLNFDPDQVREQHLRAAAWYGAHGNADAAIHHAREAGDADVTALLVLQEMQPAWVAGRIETVRLWMDWVSEHPPSRVYTAIAAHGALIFALLGRSGAAERWSAVAEAGPADGVLPDGSTEAATVAYMRAIFARGAPAAWHADALAALDGLAPLSPYRATMHHTIGLSQLLEGDLIAADAAFAEAGELADAAGALPLAALVMAERYVVARARGDREGADPLLVDAVKVVDSEGLDGYWTSALVLAAAALWSAEHGQMNAARLFVRRAAHLRPLLTHLLPVVSVQALLELARAYLELVDPSGARAVLQQATTILLRRPGLGTLEDDAQRLRVRLDQVAVATPAGMSSLTAAELRLLPLLPTHLSFPQIAEQLSLSKHTVKTQVSSLYRKLGVSSRREAVERVSRFDVAG